MPETVEYQGITYLVKGIGSQAFYGCTGLTQVTINANITYVNAKAFWNCPNLETINFNAENCGSFGDPFRLHDLSLLYVF